VRRSAAGPLCSKLRIDVLGIQFEHVVIVVEEIQSPVGTRPDELAPHRFKFDGGSFEDLRCSAKGNVVAGPGTLHRRANQHNPDASQPDECFRVTVIVHALDHPGAEELVKQRGCPGGVFDDEGYVGVDGARLF
jgi:hypothetical protein